MIQEHDRVILSTDLPAERLVAGDVSVVVHIYGEGTAFEVEFMSLSGDTISTQTLARDQVRPVSSADILHVRVQNDAA